MLIKSFLKLKEYCEREEYKGWDPYDGLNSKIFQSVPLINKWDIIRLIWIQFFKRNFINLRELFLIEKDYNPKGVALFLLGYCNLYESNHLNKYNFGDKKDIYDKIIFLGNLLVDLKNNKFSGACWGYNFDWQARRLFFFPKNTPNVVVTSFCTEALFKAYEITKKEKYKKLALSSAQFVIKDLNRTSHRSGFLFSYSPLNGNNTVLNASLLGSKILSYCFKYSGDMELKKLAKKTIKAVCEEQNEDGSWRYGLLPIQYWKDSFHTGYNLEAIAIYRDLTGDDIFDSYIKKGFDYYINNFFKLDGTPKYYNNKTYPIDIHCCGQLFNTLSRLGESDKFQKLSSAVLRWTVNNMQDKKGFFYYQYGKFFVSKISYIRWNNAFMFHALTNLILSKTDD